MNISKMLLLAGVGILALLACNKNDVPLAGGGGDNPNKYLIA